MFFFKGPLFHVIVSLSTGVVVLATQLYQQKLLIALSEKVRSHDLWEKKFMLRGDILREHTLIFIILL